MFSYYFSIVVYVVVASVIVVVDNAVLRCADHKESLA